MIDLVKFGNSIADLRKERGYTGEDLAERLHVSPQVVSKWENAKCLPETVVLPALAEALNCSIDSLLYPREFFILEAVYTDGQTPAGICFSYALQNENLILDKESEYLVKIAENCQAISDKISAFRDKVFHSSACAIAYNTVNAFGVSTPKLREEQISLLKDALALDEENCGLAELILGE